ncbi:MAG: L-threonine 3-dehydrogenase, partial [Anaerolineales bacterium]
MNSDTMKAVIKPEPAAGFEVARAPIPSIQPHEVLVKVQAASICGTDLH